MFESLSGIPGAVASSFNLEAVQHIDRVLASEPFERSPRMQRFLRFICDEALAGRGEAIKEYTLALAVFDKSDDFDPGSSAVVRVEAGRLRRLLERYAAEFGREDRIKLVIPKGSYCPVFETRSLAPEADTPEEAASTEPENRQLTLLAGERRWLTVMACQFGDAAEREADDGDAILSAYEEAHNIGNSITRRHGGVVDASASDRVMVYFGWPDSLEDTSGRAMTAALEMVAELHDVLHDYGGVRIGIATSQVVARSRGAKPLIVGQAPSLATKMLTLAPRDGVLVSENSRRLSRTAFHMLPAGSIVNSQQGKTLTWRLLRALPAKMRFAAGRSAARPVLIGRGEERALLESRWRLACNGEGQAIIIEGEAGIGKSRLCETFLAGIAPKGLRVRIQCSPHHGNSALYPCIALLRTIIGDDDTVDCRRRAAEILDAAGVNGPVNEALLSSLLFQTDDGVVAAIPAAQRKELTLDLLHRLLLAQVERRPVVIFIEDVHWADPTTVELVEKIVATLESRQLLLVMTSRPMPAAVVNLSTNLTYVRLPRLPKSDCSAMIDRLLCATSLSASTRSLILQRAEGIPLFLEELTKLLITRDDQSAACDLVPETLNDLLASQLGEMGFARKIAHVAAVIGREFSSELLSEVTGENSVSVETAIDQLLAAGIITRHKSDGDHRYSFRHALLRDAAYSSILDMDRTGLHYRVGSALIANGQAANHPEIVAGHMRDADHHAEAFPLWMDAGRRAAARYELSEAVFAFRQAVDTLSRHAAIDGHRERELEVLLELGLAIRNAHGYCYSELRSIYERARRLAAELNRREAGASALYGLWTHAAGCGDWRIAGNIAEEFHQLSRTIEDDGQLEIEALRLMGASAAFRGQFTKARLYFEHALSLYDVQKHGPRFGYDPGAVSAAYLSWTLWHLGAFDEARRAAKQALQVAEAKSHPSTSAMVLAWLGFHAVCERDPEGVLLHDAELQAICSERECSYWKPLGSAFSEWAKFQNDARPDRVDRLVALARDFEEHYLVSCLLLLAAEMCCDLGWSARGIELVAEANRFVADHDERIWEAECSRLEARLVLASAAPDLKAIRQLARNAARIAKLQQATPLQIRAADLADGLHYDNVVELQISDAKTRVLAQGS